MTTFNKKQFNPNVKVRKQFNPNATPSSIPVGIVASKPTVDLQRWKETMQGDGNTKRKYQP